MRMSAFSDDGVFYMKQFLMIASVTIFPVAEFLQVSKPVWSLQLETGSCCRNVWHGIHLSLNSPHIAAVDIWILSLPLFANANLPVNLFARILTIKRKCNLKSQ